MATRSISQNVNLRTKPLAKGFISALEHAEKKSRIDVVLKKRCFDLKPDEIEEFFKEKP